MTLCHQLLLSLGSYMLLRKRGGGRVSFHPHCNEDLIYIFLFWELRGLSPNFHIHVSVSDFYIPRIGPHISCSRIGRSIVGVYCINGSQKLECGNWDWDCGRTIPFLETFVSNFQYWFFAVLMKVKSCVQGSHLTIILKRLIYR